MEEIDEIMQEYVEKIIRYDPFVWSKDLASKLKNVLKESYKIEELGGKKDTKVETKKETKKKEPPGRKRCPNCKEEM